MLAQGRPAEPLHTAGGSAAAGGVAASGAARAAAEKAHRITAAARHVRGKPRRGGKLQGPALLARAKQAPADVQPPKLGNRTEMAATNTGQGVIHGVGQRDPHVEESGRELDYDSEEGFVKAEKPSARENVAWGTTKIRLGALFLLVGRVANVVALCLFVAVAVLNMHMKTIVWSPDPRADSGLM